MKIKFIQFPHSLLKRMCTLLMRTFILFFCSLTFGFNPNSGFSQNFRIEIPEDRELSVIEVFDLIRKQTDYTFIYRTDAFKNAPKIKLEKGTINAHDLLLKSLSFGNFIYKLTPERTILLNQRQNVSKIILQSEVRGVVTDENNYVLPGVAIIEKGTSNGVISDFDGNYSIKTSGPEAILIFSHVGYLTQEITVNTQFEINVKLLLNANQLDEVVVTGYQELARERSSGSFSKANLDVVKSRSTSTNILDRLDGLIPGLVINNAPNSEENGNNSVLIRGLNSINSNRQPLFVVDGVAITNISLINPQDVESLYVLKDATAASIYGSRATNGIIVITTKKGTYNNKIQIDYDSYINFQGKPDLDYLPRLNSQEFIQTARELFDPVQNPYSDISTYLDSGSRAVPPHEQILYDLDNGLINSATADARLNELANFDNLGQIEDLFYRNATLQNHTISARGGSKKHTFYGSFAYTDTRNNVPKDKNEAYKLNLNQEFKFNDHVSIRLITDLTNRRARGKKPLSINGRTLPYVRFQDQAGNNLSTNFMQNFSDEQLPGFENATGISLQYVPLDEVDAGFTKGDDFNARMNLGLGINIFKGLKFQGRYGYVHGNAFNESFDNENSYTVRLERAQFVEAGPVYRLPETGGHYAVENLRQRDWLLRNQLNYNNSWLEEKHQLSLLLGQESQESFSEFERRFVRGYDPRLLTAAFVDIETLTIDGLSNPIIPTVGGQSKLSVFGERIPFRRLEDISRTLSYYGNIGYVFDTKYVFNGSWRIDKSSLFGIDKSAQNRPIWSVGGKWLLGKETFMESANWINELSLRTSYGITGNAPTPGTASSFDILSPLTSSFDGETTLSISSPANKKLTWESTENINFGLDFRFLNNRINGSVDYYRKKTTDLIGIIDNNILNGFSSITGNLGDMENTGLELSLNTLNITTDNFFWNSALNFAYNKNIITKLNNATPLLTADNLVRARFVEGQSAFTVYAYDFAGLDNLGDPQIRLADGTISKDPQAGLAEDVRYMGTYLPKVTGGFSNTFGFKGFTINANVVYSLGAVLKVDVPRVFRNYTGGRFVSGAGSFTNGNPHPEILNRWRQPGDENNTNVPSYVGDSSINSFRRNLRFYTESDINVVSADYIKLRDITFSYAVPKVVNNILDTDEISFRLQLSNVMLWKANNKNIDPEFHDSFLGTRSSIFNQKTITAGFHIIF